MYLHALSEMKKRGHKTGVHVNQELYTFFNQSDLLIF